MTIAFDQHAINHMTAAICREMTVAGRQRNPHSDTLFMGGSAPSAADMHALGRFGEQKNYKVVYAAFDPKDAGQGPISFHVVVTDGIDQTLLIEGGRLWKRDRRSQAILVFPELGAFMRLNAKGRIMVLPMAGRYHDHGYDLAREAVTERAARQPGSVPVVSPIGGLITVVDMTTLSDMAIASA